MKLSGKNCLIFLWLYLYQTVDCSNETAVPEIVAEPSFTLYTSYGDDVNVCKFYCRCAYTFVTCSTTNTLLEIPLMKYGWQTGNVTDL